jgi:hypothetical protein
MGSLFRAKDGGRVTFEELVNTELAGRSVPAGQDGVVAPDGPKGVRLASIAPFRIPLLSTR